MSSVDSQSLAYGTSRNTSGLLPRRDSLLEDSMSVSQLANQLETPVASSNLPLTDAVAFQLASSIGAGAMLPNGTISTGLGMPGGMNEAGTGYYDPSQQVNQHTPWSSGQHHGGQSTMAFQDIPYPLKRRKKKSKSKRQEFFENKHAG